MQPRYGTAVRTRSTKILMPRSELIGSQEYYETVVTQGHLEPAKTLIVRRCIGGTKMWLDCEER